MLVPGNHAGGRLWESVLLNSTMISSPFWIPPLSAPNMELALVPSVSPKHSVGWEGPRHKGLQQEILLLGEDC